MKTISKITFIILLIGIVRQVFPQEMLFKQYKKVDIPFYDDISVRNTLLKQHTDFDTLWLPSIVIEKFPNNPLIYVKDIYECHENGLLKKISYYTDTGILLCYYSYNSTYIDPLMDIIDTIYISGYLQGEYYPPRRVYYNNRQADSSYWEEYYQIWDGEKWNTEERSYVHLLDTLTVSEFQDHVEIFDRNGDIKESRKTILAFDDKGNVSEAVSDCFDLNNGQYKLKFVYSYDQEGICYNRNCYLYTSSDKWKLSNKLTDIKWFEFYGFNNGDLLFHGTPQGLYQYYSPKNKNKMSSLKYWDDINLLSVDTIKWNLYPFSSQFFSFFNYRMCLAKEHYYDYNNHYHRTSDRHLSFAHWDCDTIPFSWIRDTYINKYDDRGRRYEYTWNNASGEYNDTLQFSKMIYTVDSFTYVLRPVGIEEFPAGNHTLLIVPNPSGETVRITAADEIETVSFYAADGRLAYSRDGAGKEMNVNIQGLAAGVYVVQARLKNGSVQTGKVVVR